MSGRLHEDFGREHIGEPGSVRSFAVVMAVAVPVVLRIVLGHWSLWYLAPGVVLLPLAYLAPSALAPLNRLWFQLGILLGKIVSPVVMGLIYFLVVTPIGLLRRMFGRDSLSSRLDREASTYWIERKPPGPDPDDLPRQF